ncbi:protein phosphatase 2C domain-containing protein [Picosynechococcus sp. PCC 8807]|uniref:protein phosphatase 2C domain-containing protein n=1 Tax=Picosynechococcus sp. PCC 8807 TaxID=195248 RepID=UPI0008106584|nr:protein phosphatase 2C domain-containing protein [Picosynechococcus sp. PCC 8807]ANV91506.1 protein phosphatase [Picosynechococcus sp. PCC 8807]
MSITLPYLRASGSLALTFQAADLVGDRYWVVAPQIWQDTKPEAPPDCTAPNDLAQRYGKLYSRQLHLPRIYDILSLPEGEILLLDNIPINNQGELLPALGSVWADASPLQQLNWLWQMLDLWEDLAAVAMGTSLLPLENIRVDGWRLRLMELLADPPGAPVTLGALVTPWRSLLAESTPPVQAMLTEMIESFSEADADLEIILPRLNQLLLEQSSQQHLQMAIASATDQGKLPTSNQDAHYPTTQDLAAPPTATLALSDHLLMVCDGVEGHGQGEVASQLAIQSLKLQLTGFFQGLFDTDEVVPPAVIEQQLAAYIRITNNLIAERNDQEGRTGGDRMATTLTLALQVPQRPRADELQDSHSHELYIAQVGDSRAYWLTREQCICLTVDDDVLSREVQAGRAIYRQGSQRPDHMALTQALGIKGGDRLHPVIRRFVFAEDGVLVVCSDGLSDQQFLESHWQTFAPVIIQGHLPPAALLQSLIEKAIAKNPEDNITAAIAFYRFTTDTFTQAPELETAPAPEDFEPEFVPPDLALDTTLEAELASEPEAENSLSQFTLILVSLVAILLMLVLAAFGLNWLLNREPLPTQPDDPNLETPTNAE